MAHTPAPLPPEDRIFPLGDLALRSGALLPDARLTYRVIGQLNAERSNLVLLPMAAKIKRKLVIERERKTMIAEGVLSILEGINPRVLEEKLKSYTGGHAPGKGH